MFFVGSNFVSNLIVFLFNHFLAFSQGGYVRFECERLAKICEEGEFAASSQVDNPRKAM